MYNLQEIKINLKNFFRENQKQIKGRFFEITGCGGFLLTEYAPFLEEYFDIDKDIVVFKNYDDLQYKIKYYLNNEALRNKIAKNAQKKVLSIHTYHKRYDDIFQKIFKK